MKYASLLGISMVCAMVGAGCATPPQSPTAPSSAIGSGGSANADGSTLKVTAPALISPVGDERLDTRKPTLAWANSEGKYAASGLAYELEVTDDNGNKVYSATVGETPVFGVHVLPIELAANTHFNWRTRAVLNVSTSATPEILTGPWAKDTGFLTPVPVAPPPTTPTNPTSPTGPSDGTVGPARTIGFQEAVAIIIRIHDQGGFNLGSNSTRDYRVNFLWGAVAAIHYGHPRWNPAGPDNNWCVKDAGGGRPPSDDVLVKCNTREAWDLVGGSGGNGYVFHQDYLGILPRDQNVYPPPIGALNFLPK